MSTPSTPPPPTVRSPESEATRQISREPPHTTSEGPDLAKAEPPPAGGHRYPMTVYVTRRTRWLMDFILGRGEARSVALERILEAMFRAR